jgi:hypothetical protein
VVKFEQLASPYTDAELRQAIIAEVAQLESIEIHRLTELLARVSKKQER